jgi:hypothetical protein
MPNKQRVEAVLQAINQLGPRLEHEEPAPPDAAFARRVGDGAVSTVIRQALLDAPTLSDTTRALLDGRAIANDNVATWCARLAALLGWPQGIAMKELA